MWLCCVNQALKIATNYSVLPDDDTTNVSESVGLVVIVWIAINILQHIVGLLGVFAKLRKVTISFITSVCLSAWNNSAPTERILMGLYIYASSDNLPRNFNFY